MRLFVTVLILVPILFLRPAMAEEVKHLGAHRTEVGMVDFQTIIDAKCSKCHSRERIDMALGKRQDIDQLLNRMRAMGADISAGEVEILRTFWQDDTFAEVNTIIARRCTPCHSRERIDRALTAGKDLALIQEKMIRFGARLNKAEKDVLGVFTGQALK